jgi:hypothetical protein
MSAIRGEVARAILAAFEETYDKHGIDYDPDTCYAAADRVVAVIASHLLGQPVEARVLAWQANGR